MSGLDRDEASGLPQEYNVDRVVLMPRDPKWLYVFWEITEERRTSALAELGVGPGGATCVLRVHDVTDLIEAGSEKPRLDQSADFQSVEIAPSAEHWHVKVDRPGRLYCAEYVLVGPDDRVASVAASNIAAAPSDQVSADLDEKWVASPLADRPRPGKAPDAGRPAQALQGASPSPPLPPVSKWLEGQDGVHDTASSPETARWSSDTSRGSQAHDQDSS